MSQLPALVVQIKVDPLERKHMILFSRQRAVHQLQRRMLDRTFRTMTLAEEAIYLEEEEVCRARGASAASIFIPPPPVTDKEEALDLFFQSAARAYYTAYPRNDLTLDLAET